MQVVAYHVESDRIDLMLTPGQQRRWVGVSGHNIPSFELFLSPDWRGTQGVYYANQPSFHNGNYVEGVRLEFKKGAAIKMQARKGANFVKKQLSMDTGANKVGEFSLTDTRFSKIDRFMANTLYDENYGGRYGNCHLAVGSSYTDTYAGNPARLTREIKAQLGFNDSALHWDLINTEQKTVTAHLKSGKKLVIYEKGKFTC
jgi:aminopeptidase